MRFSASTEFRDFNYKSEAPPGSLQIRDNSLCLLLFFPFCRPPTAPQPRKLIQTSSADADVLSRDNCLFFSEEDVILLKTASGSTSFSDYHIRFANELS